MKIDQFSLILPLVAILGVSGCSRPESTGKASASEGKRVVFPIGGYSGDPERDRAAGFTLAGPVYAGQREGFLERCEAAGLPYAYPVGVHIDFLGRKNTPPTELDLEAIRQTVREQVAKVVDRESIVIWYVEPEELRYWQSLEMDYLRVASEAVAEADPKKRPVWMYEPGHRTQGALEKTFPYQQLMGKGVYPNYSGYREQRHWVPWTLGQQRQAIEAVKPGAPAYGILEMFKKPNESFTAEEIATWVRHDAYASLVAGVQGIVVYSFAGRVGFRPEQNVEWDAYYGAWSQVARELNGPEALGSVVLAGERTEPPEAKVTAGEATAALTPGKDQEALQVPAWSTAAYRWGGQEYWFIVNSSNDPLTLAAPMDGWQPVLKGQPAAEASGVTLPGLGVAVFSRPRS